MRLPVWRAVALRCALRPRKGRGKVAVRCRRRRRMCVVVSGVQSRLYPHTHSLHSVTVCDSATMYPPESLRNGLIVVLLIIFSISKRDVLGCVSWGQLCAWSLTLLTCLHEEVNHALWRVFRVNCTRQWIFILVDHLVAAKTPTGARGAAFRWLARARAIWRRDDVHKGLLACAGYTV
jgi:hypothetical protein